jgi:type II secretory pathway component PulK
MPLRPAARSGMALILTLAAIVLAGGLALFLQARAMAMSRNEQAELVWERLRLAAAEAAREALWTLASDEDLQVDHLGEDWASPREVVRDAGLSTWALVEDAGRFFNWNNLSVSNRATRASSDILLDLMTFCGDFSPVVPVGALEDFVDADEKGTYEADFYRTGETPFQPPNRELWAPAELLRVHGFSADLFQPRPKAGPDDLFGGDLAAATVVVPTPLEAPIPVNVNTASRDVLMGVTGLQQEAAVRAVLALRQVKPFESLAMMFMANPELAAALEGSVGTASIYFRVRARASLDGRHSSVMAWVERDAKSGDIRILQWLEEEG